MNTAAPFTADMVTEAEYLANIGDLWGRGWSVIPLEYGGKKPVIRWTDSHQRSATFDELEQWFGGGRLNIGVVTGTTLEGSIEQQRRAFKRAHPDFVTSGW